MLIDKLFVSIITCINNINNSIIRNVENKRTIEMVKYLIKFKLNENKKTAR